MKQLMFGTWDSVKYDKINILRIYDLLLPLKTCFYEKKKGEPCDGCSQMISVIVINQNL